MRKTTEKIKQTVEVTEVSMTAEELKDVVVKSAINVTKALGDAEIGMPIIGISAMLFAEMSKMLFDENNDEEKEED